MSGDAAQGISSSSASSGAASIGIGGSTVREDQIQQLIEISGRSRKEVRILFYFLIPIQMVLRIVHEYISLPDISATYISFYNINRSFCFFLVLY